MDGKSKLLLFVCLLIIMYCVSINTSYKELFTGVDPKIAIARSFVFSLARGNVTALNKELFPSLDPKIVIARFCICAGFQLSYGISFCSFYYLVFALKQLVKGLKKICQSLLKNLLHIVWLESMNSYCEHVMQFKCL